ncbi:MAG TPA: hypothetical protein VID74_07900, partial [Gemmatimonadales bacterium]
TVNAVEWTPDGQDVLYLAASEGGTALWDERAAGGVAPRKIIDIPSPGGDAQMSPDGKAVLVTAIPGDVWRLQRVALDSPSVMHDYLAGRNNYHAPRFSPDGKWVAVVSDESGADEVYLRSYPDPSSRIQVSNGGGEAPVWSADGQRLYYLNGAGLMEARLATSPIMTLVGRDTVAASFPGAPLPNQFFSAFYSPTRDGQRFLTDVLDQNSYQLVISPNWITEFRRKIAESRGGK